MGKDYFTVNGLISLIFVQHSILFNFCRLQVLYVGGNKLVDVPDYVGKLKQLQALNLSDNMRERLPATIANLKNLKSLLLHKNRLRTLPTEIIALKCLTEVCIVSVLAGMTGLFWHI